MRKENSTLLKRKKNPSQTFQRYSPGSQALEKAPEIKGVPTGIEGLDDLFFIVTQENGKLQKKSLKGIPAYSVFNITGVSDTGKSLR
jgi:hypothetical protein